MRTVGTSFSIRTMGNPSQTVDVISEEEVRRLVPLAKQVMAQHSLEGTPEELIQSASLATTSKLSALVQEHHDRFDPAVVVPDDSVESILRSWLESKDL